MPPSTQLTVFSTKPIGSDSNFVLGWLQWFQSVEQRIAASPKAYSLKSAQRLALQPANLTLGSMVFETDTAHVFTWNGTAWVQLV
jgi:hypothetical protein